MMQARWGSHGDYQIIALCPNSPQESFELTVKAFNLAEQFRIPVMLMLDECVGHMTEKVIIPPADQIEVYPRRRTQKPPEEYRPFEAGADLVPEMAHAGEGYHFHVTGLTHDERGYPSMTTETQASLIRRLRDKILRATEEVTLMDEEGVDGADVVVVSYGITSRVAERAIQAAREQGVKVGRLRLVTVWPFPERRLRDLAGKIKAFVVPELNMGQVSLEVERVAAGRCRTIPVTHAGGSVHKPQAIVDAIRKGAL
jgi:2-oxoglutarate ferredoxin oxidoreductase subunit alpha